MMSDIPAAGKTGGLVDLRLTAAVAVSLALQMGALFAWGGQIGARLATVEARAAASTAGLERLARIEAEIALTREQLARIERVLDSDRAPGRRGARP